MATKKRPTLSKHENDIRQVKKQLKDQAPELELLKQQVGQATDTAALAERISAAIFLASNGGRSNNATQNPGQNYANASLAPQNFPAFNGFGFMSPANPVLPVVPEIEPRQFQYRPGINLTYIPRMGYGLLDFATLRNLSYASKEIRLNIEKIKSTIRGIEHEIIVDKKVVSANGADYVVDPKMVDSVNKFWEKPDHRHDFDDFINMALEELLVTDALTLYPEPGPYKCLRMIDGTTIRPTTSYRGEVPDPPAPAYLQVLYGYPRWYCTIDKMYYLPMRAAVNSPYGTSPIEYIIQAVIAMIKKDSTLVANFTEGNIPAAFAGLPKDWSVDQIKEFTTWYNSITQGDLARVFKILFMPHDGSGNLVQQMNQANIDDTKLDEWLMTVACWAYGNDKSEFGILSGAGLGGKGAMQGGENSQVRGMIQVYTRFLSRLINSINRDYLRCPWAKSHWIGLEPPEDELVQAQVDKIYVGTVYTADYVADRLGIPQRFRVTQPVDPSANKTPEGYVATDKLKTRANITDGLVPKTPAAVMKYAQHAILSDLEKWEDRATRFAKKGWEQEMFKSDVIPEELGDTLFKSILSAKTPAEVGTVFDGVRADLEEDLQKVVHDHVSHDVRNDPMAHVKNAAASELSATLTEYLAGLANRIQAHVHTKGLS